MGSRKRKAKRKSALDVPLFSRVLDALGEPAILTDSDGHILCVNPAFERVYGNGREQILGKKPTRLSRIPMLKRLAGELPHPLGHAAHRLNKQHQRENARIFPPSFSVSPIHDAAGDVQGYLSIHRDTSAEHQAVEQLLQRNEELSMLNTLSSEISRTLSMDRVFKAVLDRVKKTLGADDGLLFLLDDQSQMLRCVAASGAICRHKRELSLFRTVKVGNGITGRAAKTGKPALVSDVLKEPKLNLPQVIKRLRIRSNASVPLTCRGRVLGVMNLGYLRRREFSQEDELLLTAIGNVLGMALEHVERYQRISDLMVRYRALIDGASDGVLLADSTGRYIEANRMMCKMLGYSRDEIVGKMVGTFIPGYPKRKSHEDFARLLQRGYARVQRTMCRKDGTVFPVEVTGNRMRIGDQYFTQGIYRDLTERLKTEEEICRHNRELTLLNSVSKIVYRSFDLTEILDTALERICDGLSVEAATLFIMDEAKPTLRLKATRGVPRRVVCAIQEIRVGQGFTGRVAKTGKPMIVTAQTSKRDLVSQAALQAGYQAFVSVPIKSPDRVLGVLEVATKKPRNFNGREVNLLIGIGHLIGAAIEKVRLFEAVNSEKEKLDSILSAVNEGVQITSRDYVIQYQNRWSQERVGNVQGQKCYHVYYNRSRPCRSCSMREATRHNRMVRREMQYTDGSIYEVVTVPMPGNGKGNVVIEVTRDITDRKQAEKALQESEEKYRNVVERANDGIAILQDRVFKYANQRFAEIMGYSVKELLDTSFTDYLFPEEIPKVLGNYKRRMAGEDVIATYESAGKHKDGHKVHLEINAGLITYEGEVADLAIVRDITERKRAEEALQAERQRLYSLLEGLPAYVYLQAPDHSIRYANRYFRQQFGDPEGKLCYELFLGRKEPCKSCPTFRVFKSRTPEEWEWTWPANGRVYRVYDYLFTDIDGSPLVLELGIDITERKQAEQALRESEETARALLNAPTDLAALVDSRGVILDANEAMAQRFGMRVEEIVGVHGWDLVPPDVAESRKAHLDQVIQSGKPVRFEDERPGMFFDNIFYPVFDALGKVTKVAILARDITKRKQMEEALRASKQLLERTLNSLRDAVLIVDADTLEIVDCNPAASQIFGYSREEMLGQAMTFLHVEPSSLEEFRRHLYPAVEKKGFLSQFEFAMKRKDGTIFPTEHSVTPLDDEEGKRIGWVSVVRDITKRKRAEEALRESIERFNLAVRGSDDGLWDWNILANEVYQSPRFKELLGYRDNEVESSFEFWESRVHPEDYDRVMRAVQDHLERSVVYSLEHRLRTKLGDYRWFTARGQATRNADGKAIRMAGSIRDITEVRRTEERMRHLERLAMVGQVAARVAHEINNPLASLSLDLELLRNRSKPNGERAQAYQRMLDVVERISNTVEGLLDLSKKRILEKRTVDIQTILDESISMMQERFRTEGKEIVCHYDGSLPQVSVDVNQITQVFVNLIVNALEALDPGGSLTISTKSFAARRQVHIMFKDEGAGIPLQIRSRIFEPFFTTKSEGIGLGLAISQGIVMAHGGSIEVESRPHKGTIFTVVLPLDAGSVPHDVI